MLATEGKAEEPITALKYYARRRVVLGTIYLWPECFLSRPVDGGGGKREGDVVAASGTSCSDRTAAAALQRIGIRGWTWGFLLRPIRRCSRRPNLVDRPAAPVVFPRGNSPYALRPFSSTPSPILLLLLVLPFLGHCTSTISPDLLSCPYILEHCSFPDTVRPSLHGTTQAAFLSTLSPYLGHHAVPLCPIY